MQATLNKLGLFTIMTISVLLCSSFNVFLSPSLQEAAAATGGSSGSENSIMPPTLDLYISDITPIQVLENEPLWEFKDTIVRVKVGFTKECPVVPPGAQGEEGNEIEDCYTMTEDDLKRQEEVKVRLKIDYLDADGNFLATYPQ